MSTTDSLREEVRNVYSAIANDPQTKAPFPAGRELAVNLGYPNGLLDTVPAVAVDAFCGVSNVSLWADIAEGAVVLDLGCGAGLDTLIAARRVGCRGKVFGVDFSSAMLERARQAVTEEGAHNVELRLGSAEAIPLECGSVDSVIVNGIFNLNPARDIIFREIARVLRTTGAVYASEIVLNEALLDHERGAVSNWFA
ncbi:MAG: methyltransferase domain-containing protein [Armatimonadota bacterium]|nr:methyltransferase domain-containing protein [Armatimonadota bacterium]